MPIPISEPWFTYPPEVNSMRVKGAGVGTWQAASAAWGQVAAIATEQIGVIAGEGVMLAANWKGEGGFKAAASVIPYVAWLAQVGATAKKNAAGAQWVVATYGKTNAKMVPVAAIATNRAQLAAQQARLAAGTGIAAVMPAAAANAAAAAAEIARLEAEYATWWQQNAATMLEYDAEITEATRPTPISDPPTLSKTGGSAYGGGGYSPGSYTPGSFNPGSYTPGSFNPGNVGGGSWNAPEFKMPEFNYNGSNFEIPDFDSIYKGFDKLDIPSFNPGDLSTASFETKPFDWSFDPSDLKGYDFGKFFPGTFGSTFEGYDPSEFSSKWDPSAYEGSEFDPATLTSGAGFIPSAFGSPNFNGINSYAGSSTGSSSSGVPSFTSGSNALGRVGSIAGAGGLRPNFGTSGLRSAMATGGLGLPGAGGSANSSNAFGGVRNASAAGSGRPMGTGMGMMPPMAGNNKRGSSGGDAADVKDEDSNVLEGISVVTISEDPSLDEAYVPDSGDTQTQAVFESR